MPTRQESPEVTLIPAQPKHAESWSKWRNEPKTQQFNPLNPATIEELKKRLCFCSSDLCDETCSDYRWMVEHDGIVVGTVALSSPSWGMGYGEISYMLGETFHGRGIGTRAVALLVDLVFRETDLARLFATISVENLASQRLVERLGFVREGLLREHYLIQGRRVDELVYGILRREWSLPGSDD